MARRAWTAATVALALAGCASSADNGNAMDSLAPPPAEAPVASLHADVESGTAPLRVRFGLDANGTFSEWTFDADGDGTHELAGLALPVEVVHTYAQPGPYVAALTVIGSSVALATWNVTAQPEALEPLEIRGEAPLFDPGHAAGRACPTGSVGVGGNWHDLDRAVDGWDYSVEPDVFDAIFYDPGGERLGAGGPSGTVPPGAVEVDVCTAQPGLGGAYLLRATPPSAVQ